MMITPKIKIVLSEYNRPVPDVSQYREYFPEAEIVTRELTLDDAPKGWDLTHPRVGYWLHDYCQVKALLELSHSPYGTVVIAVDADMKIVSDRVRDIIVLAQTFGLCLPVNARRIVSKDYRLGADVSTLAHVPFFMSGSAVNCSPTAFCFSGQRSYLHIDAVRAYLSIMSHTPERAPMVWWRAFVQSQFFPCLLPPQWCVCGEDVGIGDEIMLHVGHDKVKEYYGVK